MSDSLSLTLLLIVVITFVILFMIWDGAKLTDRDLAWIAGGNVPTEPSRVVFKTYMRQHNLGRMIGGFVGIVICFIVTIRWHENTNSGIMLPGPEVLIPWWLCGVVVGALLVECYRLPQAKTSRRVATLHTRERLPLTRIMLGARIIVGLVVVSSVICLVNGIAAGIPGAVFALFALGMAEVTRRAITNRVRPHCEPALSVDSRLRWYASSSLAWLALAGATLGLAASVPSWQTLLKERSIESSLLWLLETVIFLSSVIACLISIVRSRMRPPRRWNPLPEELR